METEEERVQRLHADFVQTFEGVQGRRVYEHLERFCLKRGNTFVAGSPDKSAFNEGARAVILEIDDWIDYDLTTLGETGEVDNIEPKGTTV
jgi:hypothetical protein